MLTKAGGARANGQRNLGQTKVARCIGSDHTRVIHQAEESRVCPSVSTFEIRGESQPDLGGSAEGSRGSGDDRSVQIQRGRGSSQGHQESFRSQNQQDWVTDSWFPA